MNDGFAPSPTPSSIPEEVLATIRPLPLPERFGRAHSPITAVLGLRCGDG